VQTTPDFKELRRRARLMTDDALEFSAIDAWEAAQAAEALERAGHPITGKTGGYYRDEAGVYRAEILRRQAKATKCRCTCCKH
jgi:hypothetical protein